MMVHKSECIYYINIIYMYIYIYTYQVAIVCVHDWWFILGFLPDRPNAGHVWTAYCGHHGTYKDLREYKVQGLQGLHSNIHEVIVFQDIAMHCKVLLLAVHYIAVHRFGAIFKTKEGLFHEEFFINSFGLITSPQTLPDIASSVKRTCCHVLTSKHLQMGKPYQLKMQHLNGKSRDFCTRN